MLVLEIDAIRPRDLTLLISGRQKQSKNTLAITFHCGVPQAHMVFKHLPLGKPELTEEGVKALKNLQEENWHLEPRGEQGVDL